MENNKNKKSVKFQGDMLNFCDFIHVFVFTTNHHLKVVRDLHDATMDEFKDSWYVNVQNTVGPSKKGRHKLRTYGMSKSVCETEVYCKMILPLRHRAALAKFRCGVAPLQIETGRFENRPLEER